jgi:hypothetical protein
MSEGIECSICFTEYEFKDLFFVDACGHMFCNGCMEENVKSKLVEGITMIKCPANKCPYDLGYYEIKHLLRNDKDALEKYERFLYEHTIDELDDVEWCPQPHCGAAVPINPESSKAKCINCNFRFCLKCREEVHENTCEWNKKWKGKIDSFDAWKEAHEDKLKVCPGCQNLCEKISGCSTVPCVKCKTIFCWLCCEKLGSNDNHFNVPNGCKNTYKPGEKPPTEPTYEEEEESEDESITDEPRIPSPQPSPPLPKPYFTSSFPEPDDDDELPMPALEPDNEPEHPWKAHDEPKYPWETHDEIDESDAAVSGSTESKSKQPITSFWGYYANSSSKSPFFNMSELERVYGSIPITKPTSFSNDDYIDDDDFEEVLKKLSTENSTNPSASIIEDEDEDDENKN